MARRLQNLWMLRLFSGNRKPMRGLIAEGILSKKIAAQGGKEDAQRRWNRPAHGWRTWNRQRTGPGWRFWEEKGTHGRCSRRGRRWGPVHLSEMRHHGSPSVGPAVLAGPLSQLRRAHDSIIEEPTHSYLRISLPGLRSNIGVFDGGKRKRFIAEMQNLR
jgi:hypothetical protein